MADLKASFALVLEDALSPGAKSAKASIDKLATSLGNAKTKLAGYQSQLSLAKELGDVEGYRKYSGLVQGAQKSVFDLAQRAEASAGSLGEGASSAGLMGGALGLVAVAAGVAVAALSGLVAITESLVVKSLDVVNANQLMVAQFEALGQQGAGSGKKTLAMLDDLSARLPQSRDQLAKWTREIEKAGTHDLSKIRSELVAVASASAIIGDPAAGEAYLKLQEKVNHAIDTGGKLKMSDMRASKALLAAGINEADVAARMNMTTAELSAKLKAGTADAKKFGEAMSASVRERGKGPLDAMMNSLSVMGKKAGEALSHLFDGIDTKPLTDALHNLIALGDSPAGEGLKMGLTGAMNAIIKAIGRGITEAEIFFLDIEIGALSAYIALKPIISAVDKISSAMGAIGAAGKQDLGRNAGALGIDPGAAQDGGVRIGAQLLSGLGGPLPQMITMVTQMIMDFGNAKSIEAAHQSGVAIGQATVQGMKDGTQTHSPSVAAMKIGLGLGEGLGIGMEASPAPERAARTISSNALGGLAGGGVGGGPAALPFAAPPTVSNVFHINITAPDGVTDAHEISVVGLATALERYQIGSGR